MRCRLLLLILCCGTLCASEVIKPLATIIQRGTLRIATVKSDVTPFFTNKDVNLDGPDGKKFIDFQLAMEIRNEIRRLSQKEIRVEYYWVTRFDDVVTAVAINKADLGISKLSRTLRRSSKVSFTDPYLRLRMALLINAEHLAALQKADDIPAFIRELREESSGRMLKIPFKFGAIGKSSYEHQARDWFHSKRIATFGNGDRLLKGLVDNQVQAMFRDEFEIGKSLKRFPHLSLRFQAVLLNDTNDELAVAVRSSEPEMRFWVNQLLKEKQIQRRSKRLLDAYVASLDGRNSISRFKKLMSGLSESTATVPPNKKAISRGNNH